MKHNYKTLTCRWADLESALKEHAIWKIAFLETYIKYDAGTPRTYVRCVLECHDQ